LPRWAFLLLGILTASILGSSGLQAQGSPAARSALWVAPVVGATSMGWLAGVDASLNNARGLFRLRYTNQGGARPDVSSDDAATALQEVALMMGTGRLLDLRQNGERSDGGQWWSTATGLALVNTTYPKPAPSKTTLGLAAEVQLITRRSPNLSITVLGNLNADVPFIGVSLGLPLGRMPWSQPSQPRRRPTGPLYFTTR
jgi:hypothetical protein